MFLEYYSSDIKNSYISFYANTKAVYECRKTGDKKLKTFRAVRRNRRN